MGKKLKTHNMISTKSDRNHHPVAECLHVSFIPNRNLIYLTVASNHAFNKGEKHIHLVTGTCQTDYSGYPDCHDNYIRTKAVELSLGLDIPVYIHPPE